MLRDARDRSMMLRHARHGNRMPTVLAVVSPFALCLTLTCCTRYMYKPPAADASITSLDTLNPQRTPADPSNHHQPDPRTLLREATHKARQNAQNYSCTLWRQDCINGQLTKRQKIEVLYRESPRAVRMNWAHNADRVRRVVYVAGRGRNRHGEECALVEPAGSLVRLCTSRVSVPIHGRLAGESSRYPIDQFGFRAALERFEQVHALAESRGHLDLRYVGSGVVDHRPTHVLERRLPPSNDYPDARMVLHLDQEWLMPVWVQSFADQESTKLLGDYQMVDVRFLNEVDDREFEF